MESELSPAASSCGSAMSDITLRNQRQSPLLRLPAEIRNKIYSYVSSSTCIQAIENRKWHSRGSTYWFTFRVPGVLRSCKQISQEATTLLYSLATFEIDHTSEQHLISRGFNPNIRASITSVRISATLAFDIFMEAGDRVGRWSDITSPVDCIPSLEKVYVKPIVSIEFQDEFRAALKRWFGIESIEVIFE